MESKLKANNCRQTTEQLKTDGSFINSVDGYHVRSVFASTLFDIILFERVFSHSKTQKKSSQTAAIGCYRDIYYCAESVRNCAYPVLLIFVQYVPPKLTHGLEICYYQKIHNFYKIF